MKKPEVTRSFRNFIEKYSPKEAWIINRDFEGELLINDTNVVFLPFYRFYEK